MLELREHLHEINAIGLVTNEIDVLLVDAEASVNILVILVISDDVIAFAVQVIHHVIFAVCVPTRDRVHRKRG